MFFDQKTDVKFEYVLSNSVCFGLSFVVWIECWHKVEKYGFKLYQNSLIIFN